MSRARRKSVASGSSDVNAIAYDGTDPAAGEFVADADPSTVTDPTDPDSDNDGLQDGVEDSNGDGIVQAGETDPNVTDSDGDGIGDGVDLAELDRLALAGQGNILNLVCEAREIRRQQ